MTLQSIREHLHVSSDPKRAETSSRFFKTGVGEYGEGDQFLGITVPQIRSLIPQASLLSESDLLFLLHSPWHEERLLAVLVLVRWFQQRKKDESARQYLVDLYLAQTRWINNWDLVDSSAPHILGNWLLTRDRGILTRLAASPSLWEQRISVIATHTLIRAYDFADILRLSEGLLNHPHDLMHKACGWMLREVGKRNLPELEKFLDSHAPAMPRTMLRYAIEKLPEARRQNYLCMTKF
jgi:3-methyladenine DNA glycosylase AlkD